MTSRESIGAADVLAAGEDLYEGKVLASTISTLLNIHVHLIIVVYSKDLYTSLSRQRNEADRSIGADVNLIRYYLETSM